MTKYVVTKTLITHDSWLVDAKDEKAAENAVFSAPIYDTVGEYVSKAYEQTETKTNTSISTRLFEQEASQATPTLPA